MDFAKAKNILGKASGTALPWKTAAEAGVLWLIGHKNAVAIAAAAACAYAAGKAAGSRIKAEEEGRIYNEAAADYKAYLEAQDMYRRIMGKDAIV